MPKQSASGRKRDWESELYSPEFPITWQVAAQEECVLLECERRGVTRAELMRRAKSLFVFKPGIDDIYVHTAARVLFFAAKFRRALKEGRSEICAHFAYRTGWAAGQASQIVDRKFDAQWARYDGAKKDRDRASAIWKLVSEHLKNRCERPTGAVLYRTLKIKETYNKSEETFYRILKKNEWRKAFPRVAK